MSKSWALLLAVGLTMSAAPAQTTAPAPAADVPGREARIAEMEQLPGLYKVASQGGLCSNVFLVLTSEPVLIDAGSRPAWEQLVGNLALLGVKISDLRWVLGTHGHWDHVDNVARIQRENPKARFAIHAGDAQFVISNDRVFSCAEPLYGGVPSDPIRVDRILLDGDRITVGRQTFRVVHTPGHTPGSVVFVTRIAALQGHPEGGPSGSPEWAGKQVGFCSDSVAGFYSLTNRSSLIDWEQSLRRLLTEDLDLLFTGHGGKPTEGKDRIQAWLKKSLAGVVAKRKALAADEQYQHLINLAEQGS